MITRSFCPDMKSLAQGGVPRMSRSFALRGPSRRMQGASPWAKRSRRFHIIGWSARELPG